MYKILQLKCTLEISISNRWSKNGMENESKRREYHYIASDRA